MFQNKPVLFYLIDANDSLDFHEKSYMKNKNDSIFLEMVLRKKMKLLKNQLLYKKKI